MGEREHKAENEEKKAKSKPEIKGIPQSPPNIHRILQLQKLMGNKTVTRMIQRETKKSGEFTLDDFNFQVFYKGKPDDPGTGVGTLDSKTVYKLMNK